MILVIVTSLGHFLGWTVSAFSSRQNLILENLALRQQLLPRHAKRPRRRWTTLQKLFWVVLLRLWSEWERALVLVTPEQWWVGIGLASGCTGHGCQEPD